MTATLGTRSIGGALSIDVDLLIENRLIVQGASNSGKSYAVRRILEQTHGRAQQLVIDVEDEYASLRSRFEYVLGGPGRDFPIEVRSADLLARRLLELGVSAILNLHDLKYQDRHAFVAAFIDSLMTAPKGLQHDALIVVEEAATLAPQSGREAASTQSVIDLATRGRKRGFAIIPVTQRISDLHKSVVAQCGNRLVGKTTLDADVKRAAYELGFQGREAVQSLVSLPRGTFFAHGPALSDTVVRVEVGRCTTEHGAKRGARATAAPPAPEKVRAVLAKLADIPAEAEQEARSVEELRAAVRERERKIASLERDMAAAVAGGFASDPAALERAREDGRAEGRASIATEAVMARRAMATVVASANARSERAARAIDQALGQLKIAADALREPLDVPELPAADGTRTTTLAQGPHASIRLSVTPASRRDPTLPSARSGEARMLSVLAQHFPTGLREGQWAALCGLKRSGGTWSTYKSRLRTAGHLRQEGGLFFATEEGVAAAGVVPEKPSSVEDVLALWQSKPGMAPVMPLVNAVVWAPSYPVNRAELAEAVGLTATGGTFSTYLSRARTAQLIADRDGGLVPGEAFDGLD